MNTFSQPNQKNEINVMNVCLCLLVIFIHVSSEAVSGLAKGSVPLVLIYTPWRLVSFAVQGFLFLGGMKFALSISEKELNYPRYLVGRLKRVVLPYILWVLLYDLYFCYRLHYFPFHLSDLFGYLLRGDLVAHLYYVVLTVQFYLLAPLWVKMIKKIDFLPAILLALLSTLILGQHLPDMIQSLFPDYRFLYNDRVFPTYLLYWVLGLYAGKNYPLFCEKIKAQKAVILTSAAVLALADGYLSLKTFVNGTWCAYLETVHVFFCVFDIGALFLLALAVKDKSFFCTPFFGYLNRSTYLIYLSHCMLIFELNNLLQPLASLSARFAVKAVTVYAVSIGFCILYTFIKDKLRQRTHGDPVFKKHRGRAEQADDEVRSKK